jgi:hypothetical protein
MRQTILHRSDRNEGLDEGEHVSRLGEDRHQGGALSTAFLVAALLTFAQVALAQTAPSTSEVAAYDGLHRAAFGGDVEEIRRLASQGADINARDPRGRTPAHVAAFASQNEALRALAKREPI